MNETETNARLNYAAQQREAHANDAAGWYGLAEARRVELEAAQAELAAVRAELETTAAKLKRKR